MVFRGVDHCWECARALKRMGRLVSGAAFYKLEICVCPMLRLASISRCNEDQIVKIGWESDWRGVDFEVVPISSYLLCVIANSRLNMRPMSNTITTSRLQQPYARESLSCRPSTTEFETLFDYLQNLDRALGGRTRRCYLFWNTNAHSMIQIPSLPHRDLRLEISLSLKQLDETH